MKELRMSRKTRRPPKAPAKLAELDTYTLRAKAQTMKLLDPSLTVGRIAEELRAPTRLVRDLLYPADSDRDCLGLSQYRYPEREQEAAS
jgi:hypothetical protein